MFRKDTLCLHKDEFSTRSTVVVVHQLVQFALLESFAINRLVRIIVLVERKILPDPFRPAPIVIMRKNRDEAEANKSDTTKKKKGVGNIWYAH